MRWNFVGYLYKSNYKSVNSEIYRLFVEVMQNIYAGMIFSFASVRVI